MFAEQTFGFRPGDTGLQFGLAGHLIDPVQPVEAPHIQEITARKSLRTGQAHQRRWCRHQTGPRQCRGRSSSARCRRRRPPVGAAGQQHRVGRILDTGVFAPQQVWGGLAAGVQQPVAIGGAEILVPTMRASASWSAPTGRTGAAAPARGRVRAAPSPLGPQPASATTGRHQKVAWPRRDLPRVPFHRWKEFLAVSHALQYYTCCQ